MKIKPIIRIVIVIFIIWIMSFSDCSFAAEWEWINDAAEIISFFANLSQRIWIPLAKVAWDFLTNRRVYWEILWIDVLMRNYRNVVKNLANFCLWFYFIFIIFKYLIKWQIQNKIKNILLWILIAWVWIQASRFLVAATIDVSTILTSAVWALPSQIISQSEDISKATKQNIVKALMNDGDDINASIDNIKKSVVDLFPKGESEKWFININREKVNSIEWELESGDITREKLFDLFMPNAKGESGPMYFIWLSILKTNASYSIDVSSVDKAKTTILNMLLIFGPTMLFAIEMALLCVFAFMRVIYLWMFIILSPFAVLLLCIEKADGADNNLVKSLSKHINFKAFLLNVFKPAIIVLWFWIALLFTSLMSSLITNSGSEFQEMNTNICENKTDAINGRYTTQMSNDFIQFTLFNAGKSILDFMLSILTIICVYYIIKFAFQIWNDKSKDFVSGKLKKFQDFAETAITSMPLVPVSWYDENWNPSTYTISMSGASWLLDRKFQEWKNTFEDITASQVDSVMWIFWLDGNTLNSKDQQEIKQAWNKGSSTPASYDELSAKKNKLAEKMRENKKWATLFLHGANSWRWDTFEDFLNRASDPNRFGSNINWKNLVEAWNKISENKEERSISKLFGWTNWKIYVETYAKYFLWEERAKDIHTWDQLKDVDILEKKED